MGRDRAINEMVCSDALCRDDLLNTP